MMKRTKFLVAAGAVALTVLLAMACSNAYAPPPPDESIPEGFGRVTIIKEGAFAARAARAISPDWQAFEYVEGFYKDAELKNKLAATEWSVDANGNYVFPVGTYWVKGTVLTPNRFRTLDKNGKITGEAKVSVFEGVASFTVVNGQNTNVPLQLSGIVAGDVSAAGYSPIWGWSNNANYYERGDLAYTIVTNKGTITDVEVRSLTPQGVLKDEASVPEQYRRKGDGWDNLVSAWWLAAHTTASSTAVTGTTATYKGTEFPLSQNDKGENERSKFISGAAGDTVVYANNNGDGLRTGYYQLYVSVFDQASQQVKEKTETFYIYRGATTTVSVAVAW